MHANIALKNMYTLHVISLEFTGNPCKFYRDNPSVITIEIGVWRFQNYRYCGCTCKPHKFEISCKHLQCNTAEYFSGCQDSKQLKCNEQFLSLILSIWIIKVKKSLNKQINNLTILNFFLYSVFL